MSAFITLHLISGHCIEYAAKKEWKRLMDAYFENDDKSNTQLEEKIEILRAFIEESDFPRLRSSDIRLTGEIKALVRISKDTNNAIIMDILEDKTEEADPP